MRYILAVLGLMLFGASSAKAEFNFPTGSSTVVPYQRMCALTAVTVANSSCVLPVNAVINKVIVQNTTGNAVTGGLKFGTTSGATDIVVALTVGANALTFVADAALLKQIFSTTATQTIFIDTVTLWSSASVNIWILYTVLA